MGRPESVAQVSEIVSCDVGGRFFRQDRDGVKPRSHIVAIRQLLEATMEISAELFKSPLLLYISSQPATERVSPNVARV